MTPDIEALVARLESRDCHDRYENINIDFEAAAALREQAGEIERLKSWVNDLHSGMYINCVYCGHQYGPSATTPTSMADVLKAHIAVCPQHPMSALRATLATQAATIEGLRKDAARYLWLRTRIGYHDEIKGSSEGCQYHARIWSHESNDQGSNTIDDAIDAALGREAT